MSLRMCMMSVAGFALLGACGGGGEGSSSAPTENSTANNAQASNSASSDTAQSRRDIRIVGSSTVYPFSTKVAQEFGNKTGYKVVVESTGSGGGHKLFCEGIGEGKADITNSSRRQKKSEFETCQSNGVSGVIEVKVGYDGIVVANTRAEAPMNLSLRQVYLAFAKEVPVSDTDCTLQPNPYQQWSDIDAALPAVRIEAYGPPPTSGTRDAFVEIAMEGGAKAVSCLADMRSNDKKAFEGVAHTIREDGRWIDSGENDNAIVQTLVNTPTAFGVFGYSFLDQNSDKIQASEIDGSEATFENIASGDYPVSRSLYFYVKKGHVGATPGLQEYALEFLSEEAAGPGGYLEELGLVPLSDAERAVFRENVENLNSYQQ